jgi:16S rRNA G966 N2-methylase RsmD
MTYPGGKNGAGVYQQLINLMPPHDVYVEAFAGSAAVLRHKRPAQYSIAIDADAGAVSNLRALDLPSVKVMLGDGVEFLKSYPWRGREFVYLDPPYVMSARRQSRPIYRCEMTDAQHVELLRTLQLIPPEVMVMISGYHSEMYARALSHWRLVTFEAMTRGGRTATEHVWMNYPEPLELHDYRYLGQGFRERERIKRKRERWKAKLEKMPSLERHAILSAIAKLRGEA